MEIYNKDTGATTGSWVLGSVGVAAGAFVVLFIVVVIAALLSH